MSFSQTPILGFRRHPGAAVWPDRAPGELERLRDSILRLGQQNPIIATRGWLVVDGWHRLVACHQLSIGPAVDTHDLTRVEIAGLICRTHARRTDLDQTTIVEHIMQTLQACGIDAATLPDALADGSDTPARQVLAAVLASRDTGAREALDALDRIVAAANRRPHA